MILSVEMDQLQSKHLFEESFRGRDKWDARPATYEMAKVVLVCRIQEELPMVRGSLPQEETRTKRERYRCSLLSHEWSKTLSRLRSCTMSNHSRHWFGDINDAVLVLLGIEYEKGEMP